MPVASADFGEFSVDIVTKKDVKQNNFVTRGKDFF